MVDYHRTGGAGLTHTNVRNAHPGVELQQGTFVVALLGLRTDRARAWLDGYAHRGAEYAPVIRVEPTGDDTVTWGEFVELGYLREYRRKGVPLQRLRPVIDELRRQFATPYPLATAKPYVLGKELVLEPLWRPVRLDRRFSCGGSRGRSPVQLP